MIVLVQLLFSIFVTSAVWLGGASLSFLIYSTLYSPEKLHTIATVALEYQALRAVLTTMFLDPVFLGSAISVGAVIVLYDKLLLVGLIVLWEREDQQNSKT
jgi:hypothetical protein